MWQMKRTAAVLPLLLCLLFSRQTFAQKTENTGHDYSNAIGIRIGATSGVTFKHFMATGNAIDFILGIWPNAFGITALYEKHQQLGLKGLKFYYGAGGHFTAETGKYYYRTNNDRNRPYVYRYGHRGFGGGIDGIVGLEYKIRAIPLALSVDLKPFVEISNYGDIYTALDASLGVKLAF